MWRILGWSALSVVLLVACSLQGLLRNETAAPHAYKNPHTVCASCHVSDNPQPGDSLFPPAVEPSSLCLACHDYEQNHHPVDFVLTRPANLPFPMFEGRVQCLTCHEIHGGPDHKGSAKLLRGGPYADRREICFKCHSREQYATINPHTMLDVYGNIREISGKAVCLICHVKKPDPAVDWTETVKFRADVGFLCWRCHPPMPQPFFSEHFLVRPSARTLEYMKTTEERLIVILPLVPRGRITCSTCHNPHQEGIIQHEGAARGANAPSKLRLPSMCEACHPIY